MSTFSTDFELYATIFHSFLAHLSKEDNSKRKFHKLNVQIVHYFYFSITWHNRYIDLYACLLAKNVTKSLPGLGEHGNWLETANKS